MLRELDVPFRDVRAGDLRWALVDARDAPAGLCTTAVHREGTRLELRILGASHAVLVGHPEEEEAIAEVVACDAPGGLPLPRRSTAVEEQGHHLMTSAAVDVPGAAGLRHLAERLRRLERGDDGVLLAAFPGRPDALTVVAADPRRAAWRTWHLYPETGEVVRTGTTLRPTAVASPVGATA